MRGRRWSMSACLPSSGSTQRPEEATETAAATVAAAARSTGQRQRTLRGACAAWLATPPWALTPGWSRSRSFPSLQAAAASAAGQPCSGVRQRSWRQRRGRAASGRGGFWRGPGLMFWSGYLPISHPRSSPGRCVCVCARALAWRAAAWRPRPHIPDWLPRSASARSTCMPACTLPADRALPSLRGGCAALRPRRFWARAFGLSAPEAGQAFQNFAIAAGQAFQNFATAAGRGAGLRSKGCHWGAAGPATRGGPDGFGRRLGGRRWLWEGRRRLRLRRQQKWELSRATVRRRRRLRWRQRRSTLAGVQRRTCYSSPRRERRRRFGGSGRHRGTCRRARRGDVAPRRAGRSRAMSGFRHSRTCLRHQRRQCAAAHDRGGGGVCCGDAGAGHRRLLFH